MFYRSVITGVSLGYRLRGPSRLVKYHLKGWNIYFQENEELRVNLEESAYKTILGEAYDRYEEIFRYNHFNPDSKLTSGKNKFEIKRHYRKLCVDYLGAVLTDFVDFHLRDFELKVKDLRLGNLRQYILFFP